MTDHHVRLLASGLDLTTIPEHLRYCESDTLRAALRAGQIAIVRWCLATAIRMTQGEWDGHTQALLQLRLPIAHQLWDMWRDVWPWETGRLLETTRGAKWSTEGALALRCLQETSGENRLSLREYVYSGQVEAVRWLLEHDPTSHVPEERTSLFPTACKSGCLEMVVLIESLSTVPIEDQLEHLVQALRGGGTEESRRALAEHLRRGVSGMLPETAVTYLTVYRRHAELTWCVQRGFIAKHPVSMLDPVYLEQLDARIASGVVGEQEAFDILWAGDWPRFRCWWDGLSDQDSRRLAVDCQDRHYLFWRWSLREVYRRGGASRVCQMISWLYQIGARPHRLIDGICDCWNWTVADYLLDLIRETATDEDRLLLALAGGRSGLYWLGRLVHEEGRQLRYLFPVDSEAKRPTLTLGDSTVYCDHNLQIYRLYQSWGCLDPCSSSPAEVERRSVPVRDPAGYREYLAGLQTAVGLVPPKDIRSQRVYLRHCRREGWPIPGALVSDVCKNYEGWKALTLREQEGLCRCLLRVPDISPLQLLPMVNTRLPILVRVCRELGCLPPPEVTLSSPEIRDCLRGWCGESWCRSLSRAYPGIRLLRVGEAACCEIEGPLKGWGYVSPVWFVGVLNREALATEWQRFRGPKSARSAVAIDE